MVTSFTSSWKNLPIGWLAEYRPKVAALQVDPPSRSRLSSSEQTRDGLATVGYAHRAIVGGQFLGGIRLRALKRKDVALTKESDALLMTARRPKDFAEELFLRDGSLLLHAYLITLRGPVLPIFVCEALVSVQALDIGMKLAVGSIHFGAAIHFVLSSDR